MKKIFMQKNYLLCSLHFLCGLCCLGKEMWPNRRGIGPVSTPTKFPAWRHGVGGHKIRAGHDASAPVFFDDYIVRLTHVRGRCAVCYP